MAFHFRTVHGARGPRRAGATGLLRPLGGDDASFADRGGVTSPPFPELTLRDGDPLDSPLFPVFGRGREPLEADLL